MQIDRLWEKVALPFAGVCAAALLSFAGASFFQSDCDFCPVELRRIHVEPAEISIGGPALLYDGVCNNSDQAISGQATLFLEPKVQPLGPGGEAVELFDRTIFLDPNSCYPEDDPIQIEVVPPSVPLGYWRAAIRVVVRGPQGEMQIITRTSNYFEVIPPE